MECVIYSQPKFELGRKIGSGAYADVYAYLDKDTQKLFAIKIFKEHKENYCKFDPVLLRELTSLYILNSCMYIPKISEVYFGNNFGFSTNLYKCTLKCLSGSKIDEKSMKLIIFQLVSALAEAQVHSILHRDVKPGNIFINPIDLGLVLGDWGLSEIAYSADIKHNDRSVQTMNYRCPEHCLKITTLLNNPTIDMWSVGTILLEIIYRKSLLFEGTNTKTILTKIVSYIGYPTNTELRNMLIKYIGNVNSYGKNIIDSLKDLNYSDECISFLKQTVEWDSTLRLDPISALSHPFLSQHSSPLKNFKKGMLLKLPFFQTEYSNILNINPNYEIYRTKFIDNYKNISDSLDATIQEKSLMMCYTDKLASIVNLDKLDFLGVDVCVDDYIAILSSAIANIAKIKLFEELIPISHLMRSLKNSVITIGNINRSIGIVISNIGFPLTSKTFVSYRYMLENKKDFLLKIFDTIAFEMIFSVDNIRYTPEEIAGSIFHFMKKYKCISKFDKTPYSVEDLISSELESFPKVFDINRTIRMETIHDLELTIELPQEEQPVKQDLLTTHDFQENIPTLQERSFAENVESPSSPITELINALRNIIDFNKIYFTPLKI